MWDEKVCSAAAAGGQLTVLQWLRSQDPPCPWDERTCYAAARSGHLTVLQWLRSQDPPCPWDPLESLCDHFDAAMVGRKGGLNLTLIQCVRSEEPLCTLHDFFCSDAAALGQLDVLQWLRSQDCPWNRQVVCNLAAAKGHLSVLQWATSSHRGRWDKKHCLSLAHKHRRASVVQWIQSQL